MQQLPLDPDHQQTLDTEFRNMLVAQRAKCTIYRYYSSLLASKSIDMVSGARHWLRYRHQYHYFPNTFVLQLEAGCLSLITCS